jgi:hypothetical protein
MEVALSMDDGSGYTPTALGPGVHWQQLQFPGVLTTMFDLALHLAPTDKDIKVGGLHNDLRTAQPRNPSACAPDGCCTAEMSWCIAQFMVFADMRCLQDSH